jgi:pimeloyl-ACP methyl ester carboxylesterase
MTVDVVRAESSRFRHPLVMIHGLWTGGWIWRQFAAYLAHRGWDSWVPSFLDGSPPSDARDRLHALRAVCDTLPAPPVLIAHDAGTELATLLSREVVVPAIVAIAPLGRYSSVFSDPQFWSARLFARRVHPPHGLLATRFCAGLEDRDVAGLRPDSGPFFRAVARARPGMRGTTPGLVVSSSRDSIAPVTSSEGLASALGWSFDVHETTGHFPMLSAGCEALADGVHRWLVRTIGAELLVWLDDENAEK